MDAIKLFNDTSLACSKLITQSYSTSFSLGIKIMDPKFHPGIYGIYGFVRFADEIVDTFHHKNKKELLEHFKEETYKAIENKISLNPVLHAFQMVVHRYQIEDELIDAFLNSMAMDLDFTTYSDVRYEEYIYGSAEVVGLMCLKVFCEGDSEQYEHLKAPACKLGSAFQKVNFLRDIKSDFEERGRVYFPGVDYPTFNNSAKKKIEASIEKDFDAAWEGIKQLPAGAKTGVKIAYLYYRQLFRKIKNLDSRTITQRRIRVPNLRKLSLLVSIYFESKLGFE
ncbi:phytoene/squalene synthase family protein [Echinicola jeungdonensis]|uniref:Phytoene/squalene synthase family protein n=1 Tax=Echinicola jeungdonensis TaxID=709343 RepID=A0ABV5J7N7_9BACT|nr:phytoene/squalene synthase family protein [Echinicola jeungdonensis]MDN3669237.1 phytoene/squalene synthase family protein [Echinicola jeungdonensis]